MGSVNAAGIHRTRGLLPASPWRAIPRLANLRSLALKERDFYLSVMENNSRGPSPDDAAITLNTLSTDWERLAASIHIPWALLAASGAVAAWWVATASTATPGENYAPPTSGWLALVGALVVIHLIRRETGVRFRSLAPVQAGGGLSH